MNWAVPFQSQQRRPGGIPGSRPSRLPGCVWHRRGREPRKRLGMENESMKFNRDEDRGPATRQSRTSRLLLAVSRVFRAKRTGSSQGWPGRKKAAASQAELATRTTWMEAGNRLRDRVQGCIVSQLAVHSGSCLGNTQKCSTRAARRQDAEMAGSWFAGAQMFFTRQIEWVPVQDNQDNDPQLGSKVEVEIHQKEQTMPAAGY